MWFATFAQRMLSIPESAAIARGRRFGRAVPRHFWCGCIGMQDAVRSSLVAWRLPFAHLTLVRLLVGMFSLGLIRLDEALRLLQRQPWESK